jgi:hypothetical protein
MQNDQIRVKDRLTENTKIESDSYHHKSNMIQTRLKAKLWNKTG